MSVKYEEGRRLLLKPIFTVGADVLLTFPSATYKWTAGSGGTDEFYLELLGGGDPSVADPILVTFNAVQKTEGTAGSLSADTWDYGDADTLGYSTIYVRLADGADPDSKAAGWVGSSIVDAINVAVQFIDRENKSDLGEAVAVDWYLSSDALGQAIASAPSGGIAIGTDGLLIEWTANVSGLAISEADGDLDVTLTETGLGNFYLNLVMPDGKIYHSPIIDFN